MATCACGKPVHIKKRGLCMGCYQKWRREQDLGPLWARKHKRQAKHLERAKCYDARRKAGESVRDIARSEGRSVERVRQCLREAGFPTYTPKPVPVHFTTEERIGRRLDRTIKTFMGHIPDGGQDECWVWTGPTYDPTNGKTTNYRLSRTHFPSPIFGGGGVRATTAHRVSYELFVGPIPKGMTVDHICFNSLCVNPWHLQLLTRQENSARKSPEWYQKHKDRRGKARKKVAA